MSTMIYHNLQESNSDTASRCLSLIERYAAKMMVAGGGSIREEFLASGKKLSEERVAAIVEERKNGGKTIDIARRYSVSEMTVYKLCRAAGLKRHRAQKVTVETWREIQRLRAQRWTMNKIAAVVKLAPATVAVWARRKSEPTRVAA